MPYANNNGIKIYYEVEGQGPPLMLAHPLTSSSGAWRRDGYVDALRNDYQLVLFDAKSHGQSDKSYVVSECYPSVLATDVLAILDEVGITQTHYFGYSLGSRVGFWLAVHHPERFSSFILGGMTPYSFDEAALKSTNVYIEALKLHRTDPDAYLQKLEQFFKRTLSPDEKKGLLSQDSELFVVLWTAWLYSPPLTNEELAGISVPCLVFCGEFDEGRFYVGIKESVNHIPNVKSFSLPGLGHYQALATSDLVLPHVKEFLAEVSKT